MVPTQGVVELAVGDLVTSWREMCERYPDRWVVLAEIDWTDQAMIEFRAARVIAHGTRRKDVLGIGGPSAASHRDLGYFFTGPIRAPQFGFFVP